MVLKYFIGGLICVCFLIFCIKQVKSAIDAVREHRKKKSSEEVSQGDSAAPTPEGSEKEVDSE